MDLSVVIITWNAKHFLVKCLESLYKKNKGLNFELIIVDNNSTDGSIQFIEEVYPETILIKNNYNKGVAPARNQGLVIAKGKYILILDVDTELITEDAFCKLINYMNLQHDVGLIGCKLIFPDGELQHTCRKFPSVMVKILNRIEMIKSVQKSKILRDHYMFEYDHKSVKEVDYVIGAFQFIRKEMIDKIGLYDDSIFYGPEDIDYCLRAKKEKYKIVYYPDVVLYHFYQRITKKIFTKITFLHIKGLFHFFFKHKYITYPKL